MKLSRIAIHPVHKNVLIVLKTDYPPSRDTVRQSNFLINVLPRKGGDNPYDKCIAF